MALRVDAHRARPIAFRRVYVGVRSCIDNHLRLDLAHACDDRLLISEVELRAIDRANLAERRERALKLTADLSVSADEQNLHG